MIKQLINWLINGPKQCGNCKHAFPLSAFAHYPDKRRCEFLKRDTRAVDTCAKWEAMR